MGQVAQDMPETDQSATDFVVEGDTVLLAAQQEVDAPKPLTTTTAWPMPTWHCTTRGPRRTRPGAGADPRPGLQNHRAGQPGQQLFGRLAHAPATGPRPDVPLDLLLLDEPTNHLDLDALVWLEAWLKKYEGTMVVISHDREFLDAVTNVTLHIDAAKLVRYGGNYSKFEDMRAEQMELQQNAFAKQQDKIAHLQKFIARFKAKASKAKQAQSRVKALDRMEKIAPLLAEADFTFEFKEPANLPNPMLSMRA
jgi:ATP-binding cassette subfamily F protein 3